MNHKKIVILLLCSVDYLLKRVSKLNKEFVYKERRNLIFYLSYLNMQALMSRIECKHGFISTSYLTGLFEIFILLHI